LPVLQQLIRWSPAFRRDRDRSMHNVVDTFRLVYMHSDIPTTRAVVQRSRFWGICMPTTA